MKRPRIFLILALFVFLSACNTPTAPTFTPLAPVDTAIPSTPTSFPVVPPKIISIIIQAPSTPGKPANVRISGQTPDNCTQVSVVSSELSGQTFTLSLESQRDPKKVCMELLTAFNIDIPLETAGLPAGIYTVTVNGTSGTFELAAPPAPNSASISGYVWYDKCETTGGQAGTPLSGGPNCVQTSQFDFTGNGIVDAGEEYTPGAFVELGQGACPAKGYASTKTDSNGQYSFANLPAGTYCVSVDPLQPDNTLIMIPGGVHFPAGGEGKGFYEFNLADGQSVTDANFGWDWQ